MKKKTFVQVLNAFGFRKVAWEKCTPGFKESNYPCYYHKEKNIWAEVYLGVKPPFMWIIGINRNEDKYGRGIFFDEPKHLESELKRLSSREDIVK